MNDDISRNKEQIIRRCLRRIEEEFRGDSARLNNLHCPESPSRLRGIH
jgi:hypothetical protein